MTRFLSDQNKVVILQESGTYGTWMSGTSAGIGSRWPGEVQDITIAEAEGKIEDRFLGNLSRSYGRFEDGPIDITGTITLNPTDMYFIAHSIGSVGETTAGGENIVNVTEQNSDVVQNVFTSGTSKSTSVPFSFRIEDSKQAPGTGRNFIRAIKGVVLNTVTLNLTQGEKTSIDVDFIGESIQYRSGTTMAITVPSIRPYLWSDSTLQLGGIGANLGSTFDTAKTISFEVANNITPPHYLNGSRVIGEPFLGNRNYTLTVTSDLDSALAKVYYDQFFRGGSVFNATLDLDNDVAAVGSQHTIIRMSGCELISMDVPSTLEGANENTLEIRPKNVDMSTWDDATKIGSYNPF